MEADSRKGELTKRNRTVRKGMVLAMVGAILAVLGLTFGIIGAVYLTSTGHLVASGKRTTGSVVALRVRHRAGNMTGSADSVFPTVEFQTSSGRRVRFEDDIGRGPGTFHVGQRLPVAYDPDDPWHARVATFGSLYGFGLLSGILGGLAAIIGIVLAAFGIRAMLLRRWLLRHGQRIQVEPSYLGPDRTTTVNGKNPYIVRADFRDPLTGKSHVATSDGVWEDPRPGLMRNPTVTVLFDPRKPKRCTIEL